MNRIVKWFFGWFWRIKPPEQVKYWRKGDGTTRARVKKGPDGSLQMEAEGEKYAFPGFPRGHVLTGPLAKIKKSIKDRVFNEVFGELKGMAEEYKYDALTPDLMAPAVREMWQLFEKMEHMEVTDDMKGRIRLIKKVICWFVQEDDAYRFRAQYFLSNINQKKVKLSKADKYYARGKYWKADYDKFEY